MDKHMALAWQEISLNLLRENLIMARNAIGSAVKIAAVVKADAYGHGMVECARAFIDAGADLLATANIREALRLRRVLPGIPIWSMGYTPREWMGDAVANDIAVTISGLDDARDMDAAASLCGMKGHIHIKIDTGFHRLGMMPEQAAAAIPSIMDMPHIIIDGICTHLALIDEAHDIIQMERFFNVVNPYRDSGITLHVADSIAAFRYPNWRFSMVRLGALLYGNTIKEAGFTPRKPMRLCARIVSLRTIPQGSGVGYDEEYRAVRETTIATIPVGYADGLPRRLNVCGQAVVRGMRVPYAGLPCMDQTMLDVTDAAGVRVGDVVSLLGGEGDGAVSIEEFASWLHTNRNEPLCALGRRVARVYYDEGGVVVVGDVVGDC